MKSITTILAALLMFTACTAQTKKKEKKNILVAYFSATGTTKAQAEAIATAVDGALYEITSEKPYTDADLNWRDKQSRSSMEMKDETSRPALSGSTIKAEDYDIVFVGFPIWWDVCPRVVNTWIESMNLKGKTMIPFATSGGSTITNSQKTLRKLYPECKWMEGKLLNCPHEETARWAKSLRLKTAQ